MFATTAEAFEWLADRGVTDLGPDHRGRTSIPTADAMRLYEESAEQAAISEAARAKATLAEQERLAKLSAQRQQTYKTGVKRRRCPRHRQRACHAGRPRSGRQGGGQPRRRRRRPSSDRCGATTDSSPAPCWPASRTRTRPRTNERPTRPEKRSDCEKGNGMTGQLEFADGMRGSGTFPKWWGIPVGHSRSEERADWIARNVATDTEAPRRRRSRPCRGPQQAHTVCACDVRPRSAGEGHALAHLS